MCDGCPHYDTSGIRILIIKLAAFGDVLRTTVILPGIKAEFPDGTVAWLTAHGAMDLLKGNPMIDVLWALDAEAARRLTVREFDVVFSPGADPPAATLATAVMAREKLGMFLHPRGHVMPATPEAEAWLEMGAFDRRKKANQRTYQELIYQTLTLNYARQEISLMLKDSERAWAADFLVQPSEGLLSADGSSAGGMREPGLAGEPPALRPAGRSSVAPLVGLNLGGGGRWKKKQWKAHHFTTFGRQVMDRTGARLLLTDGRAAGTDQRRRIGDVRARRAHLSADRLRKLLPDGLRRGPGLHQIDRPGKGARGRAVVVEMTMATEGHRRRVQKGRISEVRIPREFRMRRSAAPSLSALETATAGRPVDSIFGFASEFVVRESELKLARSRALANPRA